jgi:hypothetical protein
VNAKPATPVETPHCTKPLAFTSSRVPAEAALAMVATAAAANKPVTVFMDKTFPAYLHYNATRCPGLLTRGVGISTPTRYFQLKRGEILPKEWYKYLGKATGIAGLQKQEIVPS